MKIKNKIGLAIALSLIFVVALASQNMTLANINSNDITVINTFGVSTDTGRSFTWHLPDDGSTSYIEYCLKKDFNGFGQTKAQRLDANQFITETNNGDRQVCKVSLKGLTPNTEYMYRVVSSNGKFSGVGSFKTAPVVLEAFNFINITDTQGYEKAHYDMWANTLRQAMMHFPNARFVVHGGDFVENGDDIDAWDDFSNAAKSELLNIPMVPVVGNHDIINDNETNPRKKNFKERFNLPARQEHGVDAGTFYSYDYGNAHFVVLNTDCSRENFEIQTEWLKEDVRKANKQWNIVALHKPLYGAVNDLDWLREAWGPVFDELEIDLVMQGHDHSYMRSYPIKDQEIQRNEKGTVYTIAGTGGVKSYETVRREWIAAGRRPQGTMYIAVGINGNKMWIGAFDQNNILFDSTTITK